MPMTILATSQPPCQSFPNDWQRIQTLRTSHCQLPSNIPCLWIPHKFPLLYEVTLIWLIRVKKSPVSATGQTQSSASDSGHAPVSYRKCMIPNSGHTACYHFSRTFEGIFCYSHDYLRLPIKKKHHKEAMKHSDLSLEMSEPSNVRHIAALWLSLYRQPKHKSYFPIFRC